MGGNQFSGRGWWWKGGGHLKLLIVSFQRAIVSIGDKFQKHSSIALNCLIKVNMGGGVGARNAGGRRDVLSAGEPYD